MTYNTKTKNKYVDTPLKQLNTKEISKLTLQFIEFNNLEEFIMKSREIIINLFGNVDIKCSKINALSDRKKCLLAIKIYTGSLSLQESADCLDKLYNSIEDNDNVIFLLK